MLDIFTPVKAAIVYNTDNRKTLAQIKAELNCDYLINGGFFVNDTKRADYFSPVMWLVLNGKTISKHEENGTVINDWGFTVTNDGEPLMRTDRGGDYLSLIPLLKDGKKLQRSIKPDVARPAARSAVGWTKDGKIILLVTRDAITREALQDSLLASGAVDALMCDGGDSAQGIFPKSSILTSRRVPTLLAFWTHQEPTLTDQQKVIELARSQVGVVESPKNSNNVKYNTWYYGRQVSGSAYPWCMVFVQWVFANSGIGALPYKTASCSALLNWYEKNHPDQVHSVPKAGDIVIYDWGHTGIVTEVISSAAIKAVEGNTSPTIVGSQDNGGGVYERSRMRSKVSAYIRPYKESVEKVNVSLNVLRRGSKGDQVRTLQQLLNANGYSCGTPDGDFGSNTEKALKKWQSARGLQSDGVCGQASWNALLGA